jgi:hypothetical protein
MQPSLTARVAVRHRVAGKFSAAFQFRFIRVSVSLLRHR